MLGSGMFKVLRFCMLVYAEEVLVLANPEYNVRFNLDVLM